jgi:thiamine biosynthesis lipoprotein
MYGMGVEKGCAALRARPILRRFCHQNKEVVFSSAHHFRFTLLDKLPRY